MKTRKMVLLSIVAIGIGGIGLLALPNTVVLLMEKEWKEAPPMTWEEVLSAWEKLPAEWKSVLFRWDELPPEFGELLSEWETIPDEWKDLLPEWEKLTPESKELILKREVEIPPPEPSGMLCFFLVAIPVKAEELELPAKWANLSDDCKEFLRKWETLPPECKELLLKWDELPPECKELLTKWKDLPEAWKERLFELEGYLLTPAREAPYDETAREVMSELWVGGAHRNFSCEDCHHSPIADFDFHVECMDCHGDTGNISGHWNAPECRNCSICHWMVGKDIGNYTDFISAGGFGMNTTPFDVGRMAGHKDLILWAEANPQMAGANEACVACHTNVSVSYTMPKRKYMSFEAGMGNVALNNSGG